VLPKFDSSNSSDYIKALFEINKDKKMFIMPTLETKNIASLDTRSSELKEIQATLIEIKDYVLNVRVGINDLSNLYGLRCPINYSIYDLGILRDILIDLLNVFANDFVVSGPVWNYFGKDESHAWAQGLKKELGLDRLNGFIGKSAIHPCQVKIILDSLKVKKSDYHDACKLLNWDHPTLGVEKSSDSSSMNEVKCHLKWANKTKLLGDFYGLKD
ncbi:MAG: HpcH/HpaI aldolase/citrate lyase family protein, partial [Desulfovibrionaceae bacterium]|nr:HpcH/HpaI aldolase/citrate lyase family protein [Desulfovibrionaceae bacterium]